MQVWYIHENHFQAEPDNPGGEFKIHLLLDHLCLPRPRPADHPNDLQIPHSVSIWHLLHPQSHQLLLHRHLPRDHHPNEDDHPLGTRSTTDSDERRDFGKRKESLCAWAQTIFWMQASGEDVPSTSTYLTHPQNPEVIYKCMSVIHSQSNLLSQVINNSGDNNGIVVSNRRFPAWNWRHENDNALLQTPFGEGRVDTRSKAKVHPNASMKKVQLDVSKNQTDFPERKTTETIYRKDALRRTPRKILLPKAARKRIHPGTYHRNTEN